MVWYVQNGSSRRRSYYGDHTGIATNSQTHTLVYPEYEVQPEDLLNFIELDWFVSSWEELQLTDQDLCALQILVMCNPKAGKVISGTGRLRKL